MHIIIYEEEKDQPIKPTKKGGAARVSRAAKTMDVFRMILSFIITLPIAVVFFLIIKMPKSKKDKAREKAFSSGFYHDAVLIKSEEKIDWVYRDRDYHGNLYSNVRKNIYEYNINGETRQYVAMTHDMDPPMHIKLFFNPKKPNVLYEDISNFVYSNIGGIARIHKDGAWGQVGYILFGLILWSVIYGAIGILL